MDVTMESLGIDRPSVADRLLARHAVDPSKAIPWEEVKARILDKGRQ